jgi:hypothetical protein
MEETMGDWFHWTPMEVMQFTVFAGFAFVWQALRTIESRLFEMHKVLDKIAANTAASIPPHLR